ncbi:MAG TPA: prephenate dehydrogenase/arogenate dehydrogenase family protein [Mycobacteriales bacterium]|nr:prephenate dehydrogenase/arogenate dehydrogenase family protein [Mycobacteriales bacterium]
MSVDRVGIVGAGLIGTSVGLALARAGQQCLVADVDEGRAAAAAAMGAGVAVANLGGLTGCDHVVVAVPPHLTSVVVSALLALNLDATISDVSSVKATVLAEIETLGSRASSMCGGHPIAGRERGGPGAAQPELFDHAVWAVTPHASTSAGAVADVVALAERCGARPVTVSPGEHDLVLAVVSHAPQLLASVLADQLRAAGELGPVLAGPGFRDTTRLADSDPGLWRAIAAANAVPLAGVLTRVADRLRAVAEALERDDAGPVEDVIRAGQAARRLLPGKPNAARRASWARVGVVLADRPGELARLLAAAAAVDVNVEDLAIEHAADHPVGFVDLEVREADVGVLVGRLTREGWAAHRTR